MSALAETPGPVVRRMRLAPVAAAFVLAGVALLGAIAGATLAPGVGHGSRGGSVASVGPGEKGGLAPASNGSGLAVQIIADPTTGAAPFSVFFNSTATGGAPPYSYAWTFGDGGNGTGQWIDHTYTTAGTYQAMVTVTDTDEDFASAQVGITVTSAGGNASGPLDVQFGDLAPARGPAPLNATFGVSATGGTFPYNLTFCAGGPTPCAPVVQEWNGSTLFFTAVYADPGNYTATATVSDPGVNETVVATVPITATATAPPLVVSAIESLPIGPAPLAVGFLATVSGGDPPYSIQWAWGDGTFGSSSNGEIVAHAYVSAGVYAPVLTVGDTVGDSVTVDLGMVNVTATNTSRTTPQVGLGGLLPGSPGSGLLEYVGLAAIVALVTGVGVGVVIRRRSRVREAERLARSLEETANRAPGPGPPPEGRT